MALLDLVHRRAGSDEIAAHLDALAQRQRIAELCALGGREQRQLYELVEKSPPLDLDFFVPAQLPAGREVIHFGRNSQPVFRDFQKRWCRPADRRGELWGYNETVVRPLIGPGYFVAHPTSSPAHATSSPAHATSPSPARPVSSPAADAPDPRGAVVVDYFAVPSGAVPAGWPPIRANAQGLQRFVYHRTRDYMRRVSRHASIGIAWRDEKRVMGFFVLCRDEAADA